MTLTAFAPACRPAAAGWAADTGPDDLAALLASEALPPALPAAADRPRPGLYAWDRPSHRRAYTFFDSPPVPAYDVVHAPGVLDPGNPVLADEVCGFRRVLAVLDPAVANAHAGSVRRYLAAHGIDHDLEILPNAPNSEDNKSSAVWARLLARAAESGVADRGALLAVGGGVTKDLVGFAASTMRRGLPFVVVPTTLTAMVDAGISPKTAINVGRAKNAAGTLHPPRAVLWDPAFLATDPSQRTGVAELVKLAVIRSRPLFDYLEAHAAALLACRFQSAAAAPVIDLSIRLFLQMKFEGPYSGNKPASLRAFGHAFSRELESVSGFDLTHGQAVSIEMGVATILAGRRGQLAGADVRRVLDLLVKLDLLPTRLECDAEQVWRVFERRYAAQEPFYVAVPDGRIGRGGFLNRFTRDDLSAAVSDLTCFHTSARQFTT